MPEAAGGEGRKKYRCSEGLRQPRVHPQGGRNEDASRVPEDLKRLLEQGFSKNPLTSGR